MLGLAFGAKVLFSDEWVRGNEYTCPCPCSWFFLCLTSELAAELSVHSSPSPTVRTWMLWDYEEPGHV